jgi:hypothetical protein
MASSELRLSEEQKVQLADWAVKAGDTALDYLFMTYLPLPFLAGHTLRLALRFLPAPLRDAYPLAPARPSVVSPERSSCADACRVWGRRGGRRVVKLCGEYANDLRPPELQVLDSADRAWVRVVRQLLRVGWAVAGLRVLPALVTRLVASPPQQQHQHQHRYQHRPLGSHSQSVSSVESITSTGPG